MLHTFCKSKIGMVKVTEAQLYYEGSITVDVELLNAAGITPGEKVEVLNLNNGARMETYAIAGEKASGKVCLNGPAARMGCVGDSLIILCYCIVSDKEIKTLKTKVIHVDERNRIKD